MKKQSEERDGRIKIDLPADKLIEGMSASGPYLDDDDEKD